MNIMRWIRSFFGSSKPNGLNNRKVIQGWEFMEKGITKWVRILEGLPESPMTSEEYMMMYTTIYNLCLKPSSHDLNQLYDNYRQAFVDYINSMVLLSLREKHNEFLLRELMKRWSNYKIMVRWMSHIFHYLDRFFLPRKPLLNLKEAGLTCFRDLVYPEIAGKAKDAVIAMIDEEREGGQIDRALLTKVLDMYIEIGMGHMDYYEKDFEIHFLEDTAAYYSRKASNWILEDSCIEYMSKSEECLRKEDRVARYLHSSSEQKLLAIVQNELLLIYGKQLLEKESSGCLALLKDDKVEDLSRMYKLYSKVVKGVEPIGRIFKQHITDEGTALVQQAEDAAITKAETVGGSHEQEFVRNVIELHHKSMAYVTDCFNGHLIFNKALEDAFVVFLNKGVAGRSSAEILATYCDYIFKKGGSERLSDEAMDSLEMVVKLHAYVSDKDIFVDFFRKMLSRCLLLDNSANDDHERTILTKLKQLCGRQFTSNMQGMVMDFLTLTKENQTNFEDYLEQNPDASPGLDLNVTVLTTGLWPHFKSPDLKLPSEMVKCVEVFEKFYQTKTKNRKLNWVYSLGSCIIAGKFGSDTIELVVGTYQAAALMLFNTSDKLSYSEISSQLNLADEYLVRVLQSLSCGKYKILIKKPVTRTFSLSDCFSFNSSFTNRKRRIKIPLPPMDERNKIVEDVYRNRNYSIDAAIVRIMKSRKVLGYQELITECVEQLRHLFKPDYKIIKRRIENLITREYIERDKENPQLFRYLA